MDVCEHICTQFFGRSDWSKSAVIFCLFPLLKTFLRRGEGATKILNKCLRNEWSLRRCQIGIQGPHLCARPCQFYNLDMATSQKEILYLKLLWPNSLDCTDFSVEPAVTQNCVSSVTYLKLHVLQLATSNSQKGPSIKTSAFFRWEGSKIGQICRW